jgi:orotate phosphoribosyltransferase
MNPLIKKVLDRHGDNLIGALNALGGYYICPKDANGKRLEPLMGYAGRDKLGRQMVGDLYANFALMEQHPVILYHFAKTLEAFSLIKEMRIDAFCGAPMGGLAFANLLAYIYGVRYFYPEKKILAVGTATEREKSKLIFNRHEIVRGERVAWVEDVANNFSTADTGVELVEDGGAEVDLILALLNRSPFVGRTFKTRRGKEIPVGCGVLMPMPQYEQDDPAVAEDIKKGNFVPKPKDEWDRCVQAMERAGV